MKTYKLFNGISQIILIETYWNVNLFMQVSGFLTPFILIETYWNVNAFLKTAAAFLLAHINRDILECKLLLF